jgi:ribose/xylose/arabinose/galactoside ABC-type transport system permease subunit
VPIRALLSSPEAGLILVILLLGAALTLSTPSIERRDRVMGQDGQSTERVHHVNRFLNADNLFGIAKDASFIAVMAVGMSGIIILGGIDLSVGSMYALAAVAGAMVLNSFPPDRRMRKGGGRSSAAWGPAAPSVSRAARRAAWPRWRSASTRSSSRSAQWPCTAGWPLW